MGQNQAMASSGPLPDSPSDPRPPRAGGLRERKKRKTREAIQREAMRLFQEQGYDATTIEQIAEAVEISPSTFFNYFPTKEDVVFYDPYDPLVISALLARPSGEPLSVALRRTITEALAGIFQRDREIILARSKLLLGVPALRARIWEDLERSQEVFCAVVAQRTGLDPHDFELRITTMVLIGAVYAAGVEWLRQGGRGDILDLVNRALDVVDAGARLDAIEAGAPGRPGSRRTGRAQV
jgi:AcrR family transcriptional regulator